MEPSPIVPNVALVFKLSSLEHTGSSSLIQRMGLLANWVITSPSQAKGLGEGLLANSEIALSVSKSTSKKFRSELSNLLTAGQAATGQPISVIYGDPTELRAESAMLAALGVNAVIAGVSVGEPKPPRQMPCGLWQLAPTARIPRLRGRWSFLPSRKLNLSKILAAGRANNPLLVEIASEEIGRCGQLLDEIRRASQAGEIELATVSEIAAKLTDEHSIKPQRSILRVAA